MAFVIRRAWGAPFAVLALGAFVLGGVFHHQALEAAASEAARQELASCCHPAEGEAGGRVAADRVPENKVPEDKERRSKVALTTGVLLLGAAVLPAAFTAEKQG